MAADLAKIAVAAGLSLVVGLVLGGMGPRAELRAVQTRLDAIKEVDCAPSRLPAELAGVLQGRPWDDGQRDEPAADPSRPAPTVDTGTKGETPDAGAEPVRIELGEDGELTPEQRREVEENLDMAREAVQIRNRQAWRALDEQANPDPVQREAIQAAVDRMNDELTSVAQDLVATVEDGRQPERRDMMVFAADALETMIATEDSIYDTLTPEQRAAVEQEVLDPTSYLDASVIDVLESLGEL